MPRASNTHNDAQGAASERTMNTTPEGTFVFSPVLPGRYTVTVEMMAGVDTSSSGITPDVGDKLRTSAHLARSRFDRRIDHG